MKLKTRLAVWLGSKKRNYQEGLAIYKALAVNPKRNTYLSSMVPGKMHVNMLTNDLIRWARIHNVKPMKAKAAQNLKQQNDAAFQKLVNKQKEKKQAVFDADKFVETRRVEIVKNPKVNYDLLPEDLKTIYDQFKGLYGNYDTKRKEMNELPETTDYNKERKVLAGDVIGLRNTIRLNWEKIDKWWAEQNTGGEKPKQPTKASGSLTKNEIEKIEDPEIKVLSKKLRIEANLKYISRNAGIAKKEDKVKVRMAELDEWKVSYAAIVKKD